LTNGNRTRCRHTIASHVAPGAPEISAAASNEELLRVQQAVAGDPAAESWLFANHTPRLYRVAFNILRNKEDAEDAVQDGWCKAFVNLHKFEGRSSPSTWLTRIIINSALMIRRKNKRQFLAALDDDSLENKGLRIVDERPSPEEACAHTEMYDLVAKQIEKLPSPTRIALRFREMDELTVSESTKRLGINNSALKSRVLRARRKVTQSMEQLLRTNRRRNRPCALENHRRASWVVVGSGKREGIARREKRPF
jgi:RNA polymerase sigma-70 factor (ECF subfamily)